MLEDYPKEVILKNGEEVILDIMVKEDEKKLHEFFLRLPEEDRLCLKSNVVDPNVIKLWAQNINYDHVAPILAKKGDRIIGDATLHRRTTDLPQNAGEIRIVTDRDFRRVGLGTRLAKEIYYLALNKKMNKLIAEIAADQQNVRKTFRHLGFEEDKILEKHVVDLRGHKHDLVIMTQDVDALWKKIEDLIDKDTAHYSRG
jgi:RimJ/RimL family protein N-acetyltransferase